MVVEKSPKRMFKKCQYSRTEASENKKRTLKTWKQNEGLKIHNNVTKRAREAEHNKNNGFHERKVNTKLHFRSCNKKRGKKTENQGKAYMRCHPVKERSAEVAPDANVPIVHCLCVPLLHCCECLVLYFALKSISIRCFKKKAANGYRYTQRQCTGIRIQVT